MFVSETFTSIQGEGLLAGVPSHFIRTSGCNLRCRWCDTPYASWKPEGDDRKVPELIEEAVASGVRHVVVTGGEPLIQREIDALSRGIAAAGLHLTVETAGTVDPSFQCDLLSLSPKTSNSDPPDEHRAKHRKLRLDHSPIARLIQRFPDYQLKFVVEGSEDIAEILELLAKLGDIDRTRVLLMAQGRTAEEAAERGPAVAALCLEHGFRYTPRLQLDLFGGGRGV